MDRIDYIAHHYGDPLAKSEIPTRHSRPDEILEWKESEAAEARDGTTAAKDLFAAIYRGIFGAGYLPDTVIPRTYEFLRDAADFDPLMTLQSQLFSIGDDLRTINSGDRDAICQLLAPRGRTLTYAQISAALAQRVDAGIIKPQPPSGATLPDLSRSPQTAVALASHLMSAGAHPRAVIRRLYIETRMLWPELIGGIAFEDLGTISAETKQSWDGLDTRTKAALKENSGAHSTGDRKARSSSAIASYKKRTAKQHAETKLKKASRVALGHDL